MTDDRHAQHETSTSIRVKGGDGEWRDVVVEPKQTGDPELDALWVMDFGDFQKIVEDPRHALHDTALHVQREAVKPIVEALRGPTQPTFKSAMGGHDPEGAPRANGLKIDFSSVLPELNTSSWLAKLLSGKPAGSPSTSGTDTVTWEGGPPSVGYGAPPQGQPSLAQPSWAEPSAARQSGARPSTTPPPGESPRVVDFDAGEPPNVSVAEVAEASEIKAQEIRVQQVEILTELLEQARTDAASGREALRVAQESKTAGWVAAWAAIAAAVIGGMGIIVTILLST